MHTTEEVVAALNESDPGVVGGQHYCFSLGTLWKVVSMALQEYSAKLVDVAKYVRVAVFLPMKPDEVGLMADVHNQVQQGTKELGAVTALEV